MHQMMNEINIPIPIAAIIAQIRSHVDPEICQSLQHKLKLSSVLEDITNPISSNQMQDNMCSQVHRLNCLRFIAGI